MGQKGWNGPTWGLTPNFGEEGSRAVDARERQREMWEELTPQGHPPQEPESLLAIEEAEIDEDPLWED